MRRQLFAVIVIGCGLGVSGSALAHDDEGYGGGYGSGYGYGNRRAVNRLFHQYGIPHSHDGYYSRGTRHEYLHEEAVTACFVRPRSG